MQLLNIVALQLSVSDQQLVHFTFQGSALWASWSWSDVGAGERRNWNRRLLRHRQEIKGRLALQRIKLDVSNSDSIRKKKTYVRGEKGNSKFIQLSTPLHNTCFCWNLTRLPVGQNHQASLLANNRVAGPCVNVTLSLPSCLPSPIQSPLVFYFYKLGVKLCWAEDTWFQLFYTWKRKSLDLKQECIF